MNKIVYFFSIRLQIQNGVYPWRVPCARSVEPSCLTIYTIIFLSRRMVSKLHYSHMDQQHHDRAPLPSRTGFMNHMIKNSCSAAQLLPTYCMMLVGRYGPLHNSTKLNELMNRAWRSAARNYGLHPFSGRLYANAPTARFIVLVRQLGTDFPAFLVVRRGKIE